jgi:pyruvate formate lyase activating enzyme
VPADSLSIFNIGFSAGVDGPGQRMVIYCKGCNLRCPWCAAPESLSGEPQVLFYADRVTDPDEAIAVCPHGAIQMVDGRLGRDLATCSRCTTHECVKSHHPAFELVGYSTTVQELVARAVRYRPFFGEHGGVTIGGGEPTCQFEALSQLLAGLKEKRIHTAIETNGTHPRLPERYDTIDLLYIDLKHPDPSRYCPPVEKSVIDNIAARYRHGGDMVVRIPFIAGFNTDPATVQAFGETLASIGPLTVELLPYHARAAVKWRACGLPAPTGLETPSVKEIEQATQNLQRLGLCIV